MYLVLPPHVCLQVLLRPISAWLGWQAPYTMRSTPPLGPTRLFDIYCTVVRLHCFVYKTENGAEFRYLSLLHAQCEGSPMKSDQSHIFSNSADVNASLLLQTAPSMRANICFKDNMSCFFKALDMMLNLWLMSSYICPMIKNDSWTSQKCPNATSVAQNPNIYLFLFSREQLSAWMHSVGGNVPRWLCTSPSTRTMDVMTWLLSCLWCASNYM